MKIIDDLKEAQRSATGHTVEALGSLLSLPHATIAGVVNAVQGKSFDEASTKIMRKYAEFGYKIGRDQSDAILNALIKTQMGKGGR